MVSFTSMDGIAFAEDALVQAVSQLAERQAELTARWLSSVGFCGKSLNVPAAFLMELAAVLQLREWERQGVLKHLIVSLPPYAQAANDLAARTKLGPNEFQGPNAIRLSMLVNGVWIERFAWDGPSMLQADIVFGNVNDEVLIEQLADFIWRNHRDIEELAESGVRYE